MALRHALLFLLALGALATFARSDSDTPNTADVQNPEPDVVQQQQQEDVESPVRESPLEPVELAHEIQLNDEQLGSGEQFVAVRRDSNGGGDWCAGCPTDISITAEGIPELANIIVKHLDRHIPNEKHFLKRVVQVQRQAQIVNGISYIVLAEIDSKTCIKSENNEESCDNDVPNTSMCQVTFLEKPWLKLHDGSKFRAVLSNNCTEEYTFGDEGEIVTNGNSLDSTNSSGDIDVIRSTHDLGLQSAVRDPEQELTPERIKNVEEQIVTEVAPEVEEVVQMSQATLEQSNPIVPQLSDDKREALAGLMDLFGDLDAFQQQPENDVNILKNTLKRNSNLNDSSSSEEIKKETKPTKNKSESSEETKKTEVQKKDTSSSEEKTSSKSRRRRNILKVKEHRSSDEQLIHELADYAMDSLDKFDSDNMKRVVLDVIGSDEVEQDESTKLYRMKIRTGTSKCTESNGDKKKCATKVLNGKNKICDIEVEVESDGDKKLTKSSCQKEVNRKERAIAGGPSSITLPNAEISNLAALSVDHFNSKLTAGNNHKLVNIVSATRQVVAGSLHKIVMEIKETDCPKDKTNANCQFLSSAASKTCTASIWSKAWENFREITVTCDEENKVKKRTRREVSSHHTSIKELEKVISLEKSFNKFIKKFSRTYMLDDAEYLRRFKIFSENMETIDLLNKHEMGTGKYGVNEFTDLTRDEFAKGHLGLRLDLASENAVPMPYAEIPVMDDIPDAFDWREKGAVTPVKDQKQCGSCWAFSVTGNVEGQYKIKNGTLLSLSEQELVDCDKLDDGCNGGLPDNAYRAIEQLGGLELETDYPYDARDEKCHFNRTIAKVQISGAVNISSDEVEMAKWMVANGPMSIGINANAMQFYVGGVSHPPKFLCSPKNLDHGVLIVGYGIKEYPMFKKSMPYWIVKNSWGRSWGEQGYYRVFRGTGTCGLNLMVSSAII